MCLKEKNLLIKFAATLKKFSAQGAKKVEYGIYTFRGSNSTIFLLFAELQIYKQEQHELVVSYLEDVAFPRGANYCV